MGIKIHDVVGRQSYQCDISFRVIRFFEKNGKQMALLYGEDLRLIADAPVEDLILLDDEKRQQLLTRLHEQEEQSFHLLRQDFTSIREKQEYQFTSGQDEGYQLFQMPGKVLHVDGDPNYLKKCLSLYEKLNVPVHGVYCNEKEMAYKVPLWIEQLRPDILVITGHDAYSKYKGKKSDISAYRHSKDFVLTVREARKKVPNLDQLIIFAGACQSHFESLIEAGANFASSPYRVNIHALDPVYTVAKISFTPFTDRVFVRDILRSTITGEKGIGGIETKGVLRIGMPYRPPVE
ncbi:sporulation peptidase YabG [Fervidibacillus halotolerans]|uniref:Sporulation peptidase YabG n=1 Tax=Fervidibacillus halotolerans TaxID=2980027 RepID=A0A9E8LZA7_9BACI|nr:sporulation peptidase YabG [Fervidibacillus halotolerans]WAA12334.1 sporulation peptidase YabG [Fervidibacillus halotolerans]